MKAECPSCHYKFDAKRSNYGAAYALEQTKLSKKQFEILSWWISSDYVHQSLTKEQLLNRAKLDGLFISIDAINARISELKALELVIPQPENKYALGNLDMISKIINLGGELLEA